MLGLALEGGGAKGSYQIGALKAFQELGIEFGAVTGTSIGAINAAMIAQGELSKAYELWYNISPSQVFDIKEDRLDELKNLTISHDGLLYFMQKAREIAQSKGLDITFIRKIIAENIDEQKLRDSKMEFGFVTVSISDMKPLELFLEDVPQGRVSDYIMASANLPAFRQEKLDGKHYTDGGLYDNLPVNMLVRKGYKDIIAIRTKALGRMRKIPDRTVKVKYISTNENLGSILDFNSLQARFNLNLGYYDVQRDYLGLNGKKYYIRPTNDEGFFSQFLLSTGEEAITRVGESMGLHGVPYRRVLFEHIVPKLSMLLELNKECGFEQIVVAMLEVIAADLRIERFKVYSFEDFWRKVKRTFLLRKMDRAEDRFSLPDFIKQNNILSRAMKDQVGREMIYALLAASLNRQ